MYGRCVTVRRAVSFVGLDAAVDDDRPRRCRSVAEAGRERVGADVLRQREDGVVGTRDGTVQIADGTRVRVDGDAGTVTVLE